MAEVSLTVEQWNGQVQPSGDGVLPGAFSVSATQQVHFSQGNLQYRASTNTWRFAEHQYDFVGSANSNISSTYSGWIDLFGFGTSGWNGGVVCYQPWSISTSFNDYYPGYSPEGPDPPRFDGLTGAYAEADWAWHNAISNGGNVAHQWRTLTRSEWVYLISSRTNASSKRGTGNINGVGGLIILPDSWTPPSGCPQFNSGFATTQYDYDHPDWTHNSYTLAQWTQMEAAGAVFLPAAGRRSGTEVDGVIAGWYWSSSLFDWGVYGMCCHPYDLYVPYDFIRWEGYSVRPVRD